MLDVFKAALFKAVGWLRQQPHKNHKYLVIRSCQRMVEEDGMSCVYQIRYSKYGSQEWQQMQQIGMLFDSDQKGWDTGLREDVFAVIHEHVRENDVMAYQINIVL